MLKPILAGFLSGALASLGWSQNLRVVKIDSVALAGLCLPRMSDSEAVEFLKKKNITTPGARPPEQVAVARGLKAIYESSGEDPGVAKILSHSQFRFQNKQDNSRQRRNYIEINRKHCLRKVGGGQVCHDHPPNYDNVALMVHEMGHKFGNAGWYYEYQRRDKSADRGSGQGECLVSRYATQSFSKSRKINEPFAEAFAAYLTNPKLLAETPGCASALTFFNKKFPNNQANKSDCLSNPGNRAIAESFDETHGYRDNNDESPPTQSQNQDLGQLLPLLFGVAPILFQNQSKQNAATPTTAQDQTPAAPPAAVTPQAPGEAVKPAGTD